MEKKLSFLALMVLFILALAQITSAGGIEKKVYVVPYIGDIDQDVSSGWYEFYQELVDFHEENDIPAGFSFYPGSLLDDNDEDFYNAFYDMYDSDQIALIQKGYRGEDEQEMYLLSVDEQKQIIRNGRNAFVEYMYNHGVNAIAPYYYNQYSGKINNDTRTALEELGFKMYFDVFYEEQNGTTQSEGDFYVVQYGIDYTLHGDAGRDTTYKTADQIIKEINEFSREDVTVLTIDGTEVIPIWGHQQDFESNSVDDGINETKWNMYKDLMLRLKEDPNVILLNPEQVYEMKEGEDDYLVPRNADCFWSPDYNNAKDLSEAVREGTYAHYGWAYNNQLFNITFVGNSTDDAGSYIDKRLLCYDGKVYASADDWPYYNYSDERPWGIIVKGMGDKVNGWEVVSDEEFGTKWFKENKNDDKDDNGKKRSSGGKNYDREDYLRGEGNFEYIEQDSNAYYTTGSVIYIDNDGAEVDGQMSGWIFWIFVGIIILLIIILIVLILV